MKRLSPHRAGLAGAALLVLALTSCRQPPPPDSAALVTDGYAEASSCAGCHKTIAESYGDVAMARSFGPARPDSALPGLDDDARLEHPPSGFTYEIGWRDGHLMQRRFEQGPADRKLRVYEREGTFAVGSGRHARSYLHVSPNGELTMLPATWYADVKGWRMSPGYDRPDQYDFARPVTYLCIFCHDAYPKVRAGMDRVTYPPLFPRDLPSGIDCQRCHGPGARHVELAGRPGSGFEEVRGSIVNPRRLPPERQLDICMQCHLETTSEGNWGVIPAFGRGVFSFRPGADLADYRTDFDRAPGKGPKDPFEIAHQAYRLRQSRCFRESAGRMTCTTCHDPHRRPDDADAWFSSKCLGCHTVAQCPPAHRAKAGGAGACAACHMPKRRTDDVIHVVMTDHRIGFHPSSALRLAPRREAASSYRGPLVFYREEKAPSGAQRDLLLGSASVLDGVDGARGLELLERAIAAAPPAVPEPWIGLGIAQIASGRASRALDSLRRAAALDRDNPRVMMMLGNLLAAAGRREEALEQYDAALALWPAYSEAEANAANVLFQAGRLDEALVRYDRALTLKPENADAHGNRGALLARLGKIDAARAGLEEALRINPRQAEAYINLASLLEGQGLSDEALDLLEAGAFHCPSHPGLLSRLAFALATRGRNGRPDGSRARALADRAVSMTLGQDARALDAQAAALAAGGETARAAGIAGRAEDLARAAGQIDLASAIRGRKSEYEKGRPYRQR